MEISPKAGEIMTRAPISIPYFTSLDDADELMKVRKIRHLPVTDEFGKTIGVLSERDLERAMLADEYDDAPTPTSYRFNRDQSVATYMSAPAQMIDEDTLVAEAAKLMLSRKISCLIVVNQYNAATGMLTTDDILRFLVRLFRDEVTLNGYSVKLLLDDTWLDEDDWYA